VTVPALVLLIVYSAVVSTWKVFHFLLLLYKSRRFFLSAKARRFTDHEGPLVSILLAARDEEEQIGSCIRSVLASDYKRFELIVVDDRSTDHTMTEAAKAARGDPRVSVIRIDDCPPGWTGKMNAVRHAYSRARGDVILIMDADSRHSHAALGAALASLYDNELQMVSLMPRISHRTFLSRLVQPLIGAVIFCWKPLPWVNSRKYRRVAFAWGGFLLVRRPALEAIRGFEAVRDRFAADIAIASRLKAQGRRIRLYHAPELVSTTMYASGRSMTAGWSRILRITADHRPGYFIATLLAIAVFGLSAYVTIGVGLAEYLRGSARPLPLWFGAMGLMHLLCQVSLLARVYRMGGSNPVFALGHLPAMLFTSFLTLLALVHCRTPRLSWHGTAYALTRDGRVAPGVRALTAQFDARGFAGCEAGAPPAVLTPAGH
jgi:chlorobactene glucosyltransferase